MPSEITKSRVFVGVSDLVKFRVLFGDYIYPFIRRSYSNFASFSPCCLVLSSLHLRIYILLKTWFYLLFFIHSHIQVYMFNNNIRELASTSSFSRSFNKMSIWSSMIKHIKVSIFFFDLINPLSIT